MSLIIALRLDLNETLDMFAKRYRRLFDGILLCISDKVFGCEVIFQVTYCVVVAVVLF